MKYPSFNSFCRFFFGLWLMGTSALPAFAQNEEEEDPALPYAYRHTIDVSIGSVHNLHSYSKLIDKGITQAGAKSAGIDISFRYSIFLSQHWGMYAQVELSEFTVTDEELRSEMRAYYRSVNPNSSGIGYSAYNSSYMEHSMFLGGAVYRYDVGHWSFRTLVGAGIRKFWPDDFCYTFGSPVYYSDETSQPTQSSSHEVYFYAGNSKGESEECFRAFAYNTTLKCCFTPRRHMFFTAEVAWTGTIGHYFQYTKISQSNYSYGNHLIEDPYSPTGHVYVSGHETQYSPISQLRQRISMGNFLNFRLGIGWNIGWNRNAK